MAKPKTEAPKPSPLAGNVPHMGQDDFKKRFDAWLRQHEAEKPFHRMRERADRITKGELKLQAAERRGVSADDPAYKAGVAKLAALRAEQAEDTRNYQVPFLAFNTAHNFLKASRGWDLPLGSRFTIDIPGIFGVSVDIAEGGIPF